MSASNGNAPAIGQPDLPRLVNNPAETKFIQTLRQTL
jgi:hypothetical protein